MFSHIDFSYQYKLNSYVRLIVIVITILNTWSLHEMMNIQLSIWYEYHQYEYLSICVLDLDLELLGPRFI